ncbi:MAG: glutamate--tRNA ligase [Patescibacteria group bacterium]|jgi:glutamyl-tRNA synthetase
MKKYRVRFAPSPTGELHVGSARTALYDYLLAKQSGGAFVLRIEDTDQQRLVEGAQERIFESLHWLDIDPDEGPEQGGPYAPYVQSERKKHYQQAAQELINKGAAYKCFCTTEHLEQLRAEQQKAKQPPRYDKHCLALSPDEAAKKQRAGESFVVRLNVPEEGSTSFVDKIRDVVEFQNKEIDDSILLKSDGFPTYHLAVVVDDHAMEINLVVRGEEWIPSTPKHLLLYKAFGWKPPEYAHVPQLLAKDRSKLSKRHGAVSVQEFQRQGILPEALVNYMAFLGWNPGDEREIFSLEELVKEFSLDRVMKGGAIFDEEKLHWINGLYIRKLSSEELATLVMPYLTEVFKAGDIARCDMQKAVIAVQDRLEKLSDAPQLMDFFFVAPRDIPQDLLIHKKLDSTQAESGLRFAHKTLAGQTSVTNAAALKEIFMGAIETAGLTVMQVLWPMRVALTGKKASPDVFDVTAALGKEESLARITNALGLLP